MEDTVIWIAALAGFSLVGGFLGRYVARKLADDFINTEDTEEAIRSHGEKQRQLILKEAEQALKEEYEEARAKLEQEYEVEKKLYVKLEGDLSERQSELDKNLNKLQKTASEIEKRLQAAEDRRRTVLERRAATEDIIRSLSEALSQRLGVDRNEVAEQERGELVSAARLETSRWLMDAGEQLTLEAKRQARRILADVHDRYKPTFVWPKGSYTIDLPSKEIGERHFGDGSPLVELLTKDTMTGLEALASAEDNSFAVKVAGGSGVDKEIIRLTLEEIVSRKQFKLDHVQGVLARNRKKIDKLISRMGKEAVRLLGLPEVHPEIEALIGSLNFRTSHRQNQYFHSVEVATLAGMLADEVGVDRQLAKRSGILHDIGKALDYRIEGSHAVISGDYASRFGEEEVVVDTVLSHHDDKVVETPHAYILKAADAMSGARPGARVDTDEGFQKRIDGIAEVVKSFEGAGVINSLIMHAGREVHVFVDNRRIKERDIDPLAQNIAKKLESDVQFPGQIRVTVVRRLEVSEVA